MIRIKMAVPEIGKELDFAYNENALVHDIILDTTELIEQHSAISTQNTEEFVVYMVSTGEILNKSERLANCKYSCYLDIAALNTIYATRYGG